MLTLCAHLGLTALPARTRPARVGPPWLTLLAGLALVSGCSASDDSASVERGASNGHDTHTGPHDTGAAADSSAGLADGDGGTDTAAQGSDGTDTAAQGPDGTSLADDNVAAPVYVAGPDAVITAFVDEPIYFAGADNRRQVDHTATFPAEGTYSQITLRLTLSCPAGGCDPWDRRGSLGVVTTKGAEGTPDTVVELARFITPYHVGMVAELDVSDLRPLLRGEVTLRAFIDTWVGPGSPYGDGWLLSASFDFKGGVPTNVPLAVLPVFTERSVVYGDPGKPVASAAPTTTVALPPGTHHVTLRSLITGHGQGNTGNCAEFCAKTHRFTVGDTPYESLVWRDDCATTAAPKQQGTYQYARAGWCPGAAVTPWTTLVSEAVTGDTATISYSIEDFENTCRPEASPCTGCTLGTGCDYDGGSHTEPFFQLSAVLVAFD